MDETEQYTPSRSWGSAPVRVKALTDPIDRDDGHRVLVERAIPIAAQTRHSRVDEWARDLVPSDRLRRWSRNNPDGIDEFCAQYLGELRHARIHLAKLCLRLTTQPLTLLIDPAEGSPHAHVLAKLLETNRTLSARHTLTPDRVGGHGETPTPFSPSHPQ
jgi:uncharacterized protein YeaO (DUF488 family)